jgi:hypothetical protein
MFDQDPPCVNSSSASMWTELDNEIAGLMRTRSGAELDA